MRAIPGSLKSEFKRRSAVECTEPWRTRSSSVEREAGPDCTGFVFGDTDAAACASVLHRKLQGTDDHLAEGRWSGQLIKSIRS